jgi:hypothetical protein
MSLPQIWQVFCENAMAIRWQEWVSTVFQIASVWYAKKIIYWSIQLVLLGFYWPLMFTISFPRHLYMQMGC